MSKTLLLLSCALSWPQAAAAPWVQEDGKLYTRISIADEVVEGLSGIRSDAYAEYGVRPDWTLTFKAERIEYGDAPDFNSDGWRATARRQIWRFGSFRIAGEVGALQGAAIGGRNGCDSLGLEARTGLAWSGVWRDREMFAFGEIAGRYYDACQRERFDAGIGRQVSENIWNITQAWIERGSPNAQSYKIQSELLWRTELADFSFGYRQEVGGAFQEESIFLAVANQF